ncbi:hypothetical protein [Desulfonatronum sp. SC1]|uniref:hypothetical protein n=1 Tax=Desulfonatronum sp. SC1 TaxID=2109626 RepID=UPI000D2FA6A3|nr:hypothetical protein [Desulfonatronum sp. SC1]PTN38039.1 hypothetical protein C6366_04025 [Desulfonatronum sp. SC1]
MKIHKKARLINCLDTILETESQLRSLREAGSLASEFSSLRSLIRDLKLERISMDEADIKRIELATTFFLQELEVRFQYLETPPHANRLLQ